MKPQLTAHYLANRYPERINILCECPHAGKKQKHHPDYDKAYEIQLLCHKCHAKTRRKVYARRPRHINEEVIGNLRKLVKKFGGKTTACEQLGITLRYVNMILAGSYAPSKRLVKLIKIYLAS